MMRMIVAGAAALGLLAAPALAEPELQSGETRLVVEAAGSVRIAADLVTTNWSVSAEGAGDDEVRELLERRLALVAAIAGRHGAAPADIDILYGGGDGFALHEEVVMAELARGGARSGAVGRRAATVSITLRDPKRLPALRKALDDERVRMIGLPDHRLADEALASRAAKLDGLRRARADADAYAAAIGMRVARILEISDGRKAAADVSPATMIAWAARQDDPDPVVDSEAIVTVTFALAPR